MEPSAAGRGPATLLGVGALLFWGASVAVARSLTQKLGPVGAGAIVYLLGGAISLTYLALRRGHFREALGLPRRYLLVCGALFMACTVSYYLALGLAADSQQAIEAGTINYLWTALTVIFAVPIQGHRARWTLAPGVLLAVAGMVLSMAPPGEWSLPRFQENLVSHWPPYALGLVAALSWGLYSNLTRKWAGRLRGNAVPFFLAATGLVMIGFWLAFPHPELRWTGGAVGELLFLGLISTSLAYVFWDVAMRRGNLVLVASLSYFTPLLSAIVGSFYLGVRLGWSLWAACGLIIAGAALCRYSVVERPAAEEPAGEAAALDTARGGS